MAKGKISKVDYVKEWGEGLNKVHYHDVWFEGDNTKYNIGTKKQSPDFLVVGKQIEYEITDDKKNKIKRASTMGGNNGSDNRKSYGAPSYSKKSEPSVNPDSTSMIRSLDSYNESDLIFLDIETVRAVKELKPGTPLYDAWEYKTRYNNELERKTGEPVTMEQYFNDKASLYAVFAKVVVVVAGRINGDQLSVKKYYVTKETKWDEKVMLENFNNDIKLILGKNPNSAFAGWANFSFDQPFLSKRMIINGVQPNILLDNSHKKPWEISGIDLKEQWKNGAFYPDSLISVATAFGLQSPKTKMDGSEVGEYYFQGKIEEIAEYCTTDVLTTANIYRKLVNKPILTLK